MIPKTHGRLLAKIQKQKQEINELKNHLSIYREYVDDTEHENEKTIDDLKEILRVNNDPRIFEIFTRLDYQHKNDSIEGRLSYEWTR